MPLAVEHQAPIEAKRRQGQVIAQGIGAVGAMAAQYAQKHKDTDIAADEAGFALFSKDRMTKANAAAEQTSNPDEVKSIYDSAESDIEGYVSGSGANGTPNVKWKDHQEEMKNKIAPMKGRIREISSGRVLDIYKADTAAKAKMIVTDGIRSGDEAAIREGAEILQGSGQLTAQEKKQYVKENITAMNKFQSNRGYNQLLETTATLELAFDRGEIGDQELLAGYDDIQSSIETLVTDENQKVNLNYQLTSKKSKIYSREKKAIQKNMDAIYREGAKGSFGAGDGADYLGRFGENMKVSVAVKSAQKLREGAELTAGEEMSAAIQVANDVMSGKLYVSDGMQKISEMDPAVSYVANYILGGAMLDDSSNLNGEDFHSEFIVRDVKFGFDKKVEVNEGAFIHTVLRSMGPYLMGGNMDHKFAKETFDKAIYWQNNEGQNATAEEKKVKFNQLFMGRALDMIRSGKTPEQNAATEWAIKNLNEPRNADKARLILNRLGER
jgi:hypothetical protein